MSPFSLKSAVLFLAFSVYIANGFITPGRKISSHIHSVNVKATSGSILKKGLPEEKSKKTPSKIELFSAVTSRLEKRKMSSKEELMELADGKLCPSLKKKTLISELILKLEARNPTPAPALSPILNGAWEIVHSNDLKFGTKAMLALTNMSNSPSGFVRVKDARIEIQREQPRITTSATFGVLGREVKLKVRSKLEAESDVRLVEQKVEFGTGRFDVPIPRVPDFCKKSVLISYLDDDILIVRDVCGIPTVLMRKVAGQSKSKSKSV